MNNYYNSQYLANVCANVKVPVCFGTFPASSKSPVFLPGSSTAFPANMMLLPKWNSEKDEKPKTQVRELLRKYSLPHI